MSDWFAIDNALRQVELPSNIGRFCKEISRSPQARAAALHNPCGVSGELVFFNDKNVI